MAEQQADSQQADELTAAVAAVKKNPTDPARWDRMDELLETVQRPEVASPVFAHVLRKRPSAELVTEVGQRGVRFYETWYGEDSKELAAWLEAVLEADPGAQWAFERLTIAHTVGERWGALLDAYDRAVETADQTSRRMRLLEEAAQVAKDFANAPDRAIGYMLRLHALDPDNVGLAAGLERLLERQERWEDLVGLWQSRLNMQAPKQAQQTRLRMANVYLDKLARYPEALAQGKHVLGEAPDNEAAHDVIERVLAAQQAGASERREALSLLRQRHLDANKPEAVVRVVEQALGYAEDHERRALLRELVERFSDLGNDARASQHQAELLVLEPLPRERDTLFALCERTRNHELFAESLQKAAARCEQPGLATELLLEAGRTLETVIGDAARACEIYQRVFASQAPEELVAEAGRRVIPLLERAGREAELLEALARMSELSSAPEQRRALLGKVAELAKKLGDGPRAAIAWQARLSLDAEDIDALDALIASACDQQQWQALAQLLQQRIKAPAGASRRRQDQVWLASTLADRLSDPSAAVEVWRGIQHSFGEDTESVTALTDLLSRAERWPELAEVLSQAAARQIARFTELQTQLGDAYRERLDQPELAAQRYRDALQVEPRSESARQGQHALLADERCNRIAVPSLTDAYARTGQWQKTLSLLEPRLLIAGSPAAQAAVLCEAAELHEERGADPGAALLCLRRAFALVPEDRALERKLRRVAEGLGAFDAVVQAYRDTITRLPASTPRAAELRFEEGKLLQERVLDLPGAHAAYAEACAIAPDRIEFVLAATQLAAELLRWDAAIAHVHACIAARGTLLPELLTLIEAAAIKAKAADAFAEAWAAVLAQASVSGKLKGALYARLSNWHKTQRKDEDAAEAALVQSIQAQPGELTILRELADLQRRAPGLALCETLAMLYEVDRDNLDPLLEAAEVARTGIPAVEQRMALWQRLYERATDFMRNGTEPSGQATAVHCLRFAIDQLVGSLAEQGHNERALQLLLGASVLPMEPELRREDLHRAALIAAHDLHDEGRATALYRDLLQTDPTDRVAMSALAKLYQAGKRLPELLALKQSELAMERDAERRLTLRLELSALLGDIEARGGRSQVLLENLHDRPGHVASLSSLSALMTAEGKQRELAELLRRQAEQLVRQSDPERAATLLAQAAALYEQVPGQVDASIATYRELYDLDPTGDATAALARLHAAQGEHAQAAKWLELRLGTVPPDTRAVTAIELAEALLEAGDRVRARSCLESAMRDTPNLPQARSLLAEIYRKDNAFEPLAGLLSEAAQHQSDSQKRLELLREAATIYCDTLGTPERAIEILEQAVALAPTDRELGVRLAETLAAAGRLQSACTAFEGLIEAFGRKRTPERAELHYRLARVRKAAGEVPRAIEELDSATKMDPSHVAAMHLLAQSCQELGDLDRAERTYRGLLMLVRRQKPGERQTLFQSEVFYALSVIANAHGHKAQADELLESAMETASQHDVEARRFQEVLRKHEELTLLMTLLDVREKLAQAPAEQAEILQTRAEVLADMMGQPADAFALLLRALGLAPENDTLHQRALGLAAGLGELDRYLHCLAALSEEAARKRDAAGRRLAARLTLRMGEAIEHGLGDLDRALGLYAKVESSGELLVDAWMAMARVAGARGDHGEERRVLTQITERSSDQVSPEERRSALFTLIDLELADAAWREAGILRLESALEGLTDYERAKSIVRAAIAKAPDDVGLGRVFERVARTARDQGMLLEHFERVAAGEGAAFQPVREGIELALRVSEFARAEKLLTRADAMLKGAKADISQKTWVLSRLSDCRKRVGDVAGAVRYLDQAVEFADEDQAEVLLRALAHLSSGEGGDIEVAARTYTRLLALDPTDSSLWQPLLGIYRKLGDRARFDSFAEQCLHDLISPVDRAHVELARAKFLIDVLHDERAAVPSLKAVLDHNPGDPHASDLLTQILQKNGMNDELADVLLGHFDRARDSGNVDAIVELSLRIGSLYDENRRDAAIDVYRSALEWAPAHDGLLRALVATIGHEGDQRERADTMHALLKVERGADAAQLALEVFSAWTTLSEPELAQQALELGLAASPDDTVLRDRLESFYAAREMWRPLAQLLEREADNMGATAQAVARLKNAASMYREGLKDLEGSAAVLRKALAIDPGDLSLLVELARNLASAGQHEVAIADVSGLLDGHPEADTGRVELLKVRAELRLATEMLSGALSDLEEAYAIDSERCRPALVEALERQKSAAFARSDTKAEREAAMRLVEVLDAGDTSELAREVLSTWLEQSPDDVEALLMLRRRDESAGRWDEVVGACTQLLNVQTDAAQIETALALADACAKAGRPDGARDGLERVQRAHPEHKALRSRLRELYEAIGERHELAGILLADAYATSEPVARMELFQRTARLYLELGDASSALVPLGEAARLKPDDAQTQLLMIDISLQLGRMQEAASLLDTAIAAQKRKRTPELAQLYRRMARMASLQGDATEQLKCLNQAVEVDRKSSEIAAELAEAAIACGDHEVAMKALRAITMMDDPKPIGRALAFLMQARIAQQGGDPRRAQHWARKAKSLDEHLPEVDQFLTEVEG